MQCNRAYGELWRHTSRCTRANQSMSVWGPLQLEGVGCALLHLGLCRYNFLFNTVAVIEGKPIWATIKPDNLGPTLACQQSVKHLPLQLRNGLDSGCKSGIYCYRSPPRVLMSPLQRAHLQNLLLHFLPSSRFLATDPSRFIRPLFETLALDLNFSPIE